MGASGRPAHPRVGYSAGRGSVPCGVGGRGPAPHSRAGGPLRALREAGRLSVALGVVAHAYRCAAWRALGRWAGPHPCPGLASTPLSAARARLADLASIRRTGWGPGRRHGPGQDRADPVRDRGSARGGGGERPGPRGRSYLGRGRVGGAGRDVHARPARALRR